ncbi:MAG TPA: NnrS family protein, partial [Rubrivivax sp.]|nr:NnrS family protein [Rubrivivax sp.]
MLTRLDHDPPALLLCGFRPFFLLTALGAALAMAAWGLFLGGHAGLPAVAGGPLSWHGHEMVFGFGLAAVAGFALTAVPEFTASAPVPPRTTATLVILWLLARIGFAIGGTFGGWLAASAETVLMGGLIACLAPRLWRDPGRAHLSFLWALLALLATVVGYHAETLAGQGGTRWLHAATGVLMVLLIVAMSRISMRIVNAALEARGDSDTPYRARPPRRNLATFCITLHALLTDETREMINKT